MPVTHRSPVSSPLFHLRHFSALSSHSSNTRDSQFRRSDFSGQGFTGTYEPGAPTRGPLAQASKHEAPRLTPALLKEHLDKFIVGQTKAKKVTSVAIFNHYQRIREIQRLEARESEKRARQERALMRERERDSHPLENEYPGHVESVDLNYIAHAEPSPELGTRPITLDDSPTIIEKSNLLLLGPSGVGKTYILSTLARILEVPFATVDCSSLTQAGYIGSDIESSIERLLLAASNSISKCESGIIFFDEVDKLAKPAVVSHGRDVSGEGVQQGLLKMIEGTTVTVSAKNDKNSKTENAKGREGIERSGQGQQMKNEQCTVDTSNILFVFAGAFIGLEKIISARLSSSSSLGFGSQLKNPFQQSSSQNTSSPPPSLLHHVTPSDLQTYGLLPELIGRIPILTALHPLSQSQLVSILTEPRNSLVKQYIALFDTYGIELRFTTPALHAIAARTLTTSTGGPKGKGNASAEGSIGARGLRAVMESVLSEIMFWGPGSGIRYCLIDERFATHHHSESKNTSSSSTSASSISTNAETTESNKDSGETMPRCFSRGQRRVFEDAWTREEDEWRDREICDRTGEGKGGGGVVEESLERYRAVGRSGM